MSDVFAQQLNKIPIHNLYFKNLFWNYVIERFDSNVYTGYNVLSLR